MRLLSRPLCGISGVLLLTCLILLPGCAPRRYGTQALFTKRELIMRHRLAVLGLTPEQEQILMACYTKTFSGQVITFVERNRLVDLLGEQDLLKGRLDDATRAKIQRILGVEALILCEYYDAATGKAGKKLRIRIVDSETGAIIGSVITTAPDNFHSHAYAAVNALRDDLMGGGNQRQREPAERMKMRNMGRI